MFLRIFYVKAPFSLCVLLMFLPVLVVSQNEKQIDSINNLYVQGLNIPQEKIIALFNDNIKQAQHINYQKGVADALAKLSLIYGYQGVYDESTKYGLRAIKLYDSLGMQDVIAYSYAQLGYSMKYSNLDKALEYMQLGKKVAERDSITTVLKDIYNNYGVLKEIQQDLDSALYYYNRSLSIKKEERDTVGIPYSLSNIAGVYGLQKKFKEAKTYFNTSLQTRLRYQDSTGVAENYTQIAEVYMAEEKWQQAISYVHQSLPMAQAKQYRNLTQYNYKLLSDIYKTQNNADSALYYFEQYATIKDSMHNISVNETIAKLSIEFETEKKEKEILKQRATLVEREAEVDRKNTMLFGSLSALVLVGLVSYLLYQQQKLKNRQIKKEAELETALARIETQNRLQEQRLRISRDLHDNIGAQLTFIISSIDNLKYGFTDMSEKLAAKLSGISGFTSQTIYELRDTIWAMNKNEITFEDLQARISNFIEKARDASQNTAFSFQISSEVDTAYTFTSVQGMNSYRIIQEAVNNALKYAEATSISVMISEENKTLNISIIDDGIGFATSEVILGNGLNNIKKRAREAGGEIEILSESNRGTVVKVIIHKIHKN